MDRLRRDDRGAITAEFAITLPVVLLVLGLVIASVQLSAHRVALTGLAGDIARLEARGDAALAAERLERFTGNPRVVRSEDGRVLCVDVTVAPESGLLAALSVTGRGCAAVMHIPPIALPHRGSDSINDGP